MIRSVFLSECDRLLGEAFEILEYHGVENQEFESQSKTQLRKAVPFMHSILSQGDLRWEGEKLRIATRYKNRKITLYLDPDRIHEAAYRIERRRMVNGTLLARKDRRRRELREEHVRDARCEARKLG